MARRRRETAAVPEVVRGGVLLVLLVFGFSRCGVLDAAGVFVVGSTPVVPKRMTTA